MKFKTFSSIGRSLLINLYEFAPSFISESDEHLKDEMVLIPYDEMECTDTDASSIWHKVHHAWNHVQSSDSNNQMPAWSIIMQYGQEIAPGSRVFLLKQNNRKQTSYFYLSSKKDPDEALKHFLKGLDLLRDRHHIKQGRAIFHSSAIANRDAAFLFLGKSGAGKSTVCELSNSEQYAVIHDDNVLIYEDPHQTYTVTDKAMSIPGAPIRALFFLAQDTKDYLTPISPIAAAKRLVESSLESFANQILHGQALQHTFAISASIARAIPAYELHFRKSPDFWDVIHAECGRSD